MNGSLGSSKGKGGITIVNGVTTPSIKEKEDVDAGERHTKKEKAWGKKVSPGPHVEKGGRWYSLGNSFAQVRGGTSLKTSKPSMHSDV